MKRLVLLVLVSVGIAAEPSGKPEGPNPGAIGEGVNASRHAHYPVRVRNLERLAWRFSEGAHTGFACPGKDGVVRIQGGGGHIRGVDEATGKRLWIASGTARFFNYSACVGGPDETVYGGNHTSLNAVGKDGKKRWSVDLGASWIHMPPAVSPDGRTVYAGGDALGLAALDAATGRVRWLRRDFRSNSTTYCFDERANVIANLPAGIVSFDARGGEIWRIDGRHGPIMTVGPLLLAPQGNTLLAYQLQSRKVAWRADLKAPVRGIAYSDHGRIIVSTKDGRLIALARDGKTRWNTKVSAHMLQPPITAAGGDALVMDREGVLYLVDGRGKVEQKVATGGAPFRWRPTIGADGSVFVNHRDTVLKYTGTERAPAEPLVATEMVAVADDFVVDVWLNGKKLPLNQRELLAEIHGASTERIRADLHAGDWVVFHVVANRMRWGGASYFGVRGTDPWGQAAFVSTTRGNWSYCDDPSRIAEFIANRGVGADQLAKKPARPWRDAARIWRDTIGGEFDGEPIWGEAPSTWIKFIVPRSR